MLFLIAPPSVPGLLTGVMNFLSTNIKITEARTLWYASYFGNFSNIKCLIA